MPAGKPEEGGDEWKAATAMAAAQRGKAARQLVKGQMEAATKLQAIQRGRLARKESEHPSSTPTGMSTAARAAAARAKIALAAPAGGVYSHKALLKLGVKGMPLVNPVPGLQFLTFFSWWNEAGTKRYVEICFDLKREFFQVILDKSVRHISGGHIAVADAMYNPQTESYQGVTKADTKVLSMRLHEKLSGNQHASSLKQAHLEAWDLHVGARLNVLGRPTTLMQANLLTAKWLDYHADRLTRVKLALGEHLRKYETFEVPMPATKRRATGSVDLRLLLNQIDALQERLGQYRPTLAATLGDCARRFEE